MSDHQQRVGSLREYLGKTAESAMEPVEPASPPADADIARRAIEEELKASSLYERLARDTSGPTAELLRDVSDEEKTHAGEFRSLLERLDPQYAKADEEGADEAKDIVKSAVEKLEIGPMGYPKGTGRRINQAAGKPGLGLGMSEGRAGRVAVLKRILLAKLGKEDT